MIGEGVSQNIDKGREGLETEVHARDYSLALHWGAGHYSQTICVAPSQTPGNTFTCLRPYADLSKVRPPKLDFHTP